MVDIADSGKFAFLATEYNEFLFASIGADGNGTYLTVASALARLDLDPWVEAAKLARLPRAIASQKLAELISEFPEIPVVRHDSAKIAARLTALLPGRARADFPMRKSQPDAKMTASPQSALTAFFIAFAVIMGMQLIMNEFHHVHHTPAGNPHTVASNSFPSRPPLISGPRILVSGR